MFQNGKTEHSTFKAGLFTYLLWCYCICETVTIKRCEFQIKYVSGMVQWPGVGTLDGDGVNEREQSMAMEYGVMANLARKLTHQLSNLDTCRIKLAIKLENIYMQKIDCEY